MAPMRMLRRSSRVGLATLWAVAVAVVGARAAEEKPAGERVPSALFDYVSRPDPEFAWEIKDKRQLDGGLLYDVDLTSQKWQGIVWKHVLHVYEPKDVRYPRHVLLFITGGANDRRPGDDSLKTGFKLAELCGARVAMLHQVPNQPLLGDRKEDDLITETWLRYMETGDSSWPLLFPMVKSAVRAMDAVEAIARSQWNGPVAGFVTTGASKRGWTSWLAPVADKRIIATAPIVIDTLNFRRQMDYQIETWGRHSEQIADYTRKGFFNSGEEPAREAELRVMQDPYTYRHRLSLPKLMINGTNDPYWVVDAAKFYWYDLVGPKYVLEIPNAGHGLDGGRELAFRTLAAFFRQTAAGGSLPQLDWKHSDGDGQLVLAMKSSAKPAAARLWVAHSPTKDFRPAKWRPQPVEEKSGGLVGRVAKPRQGHVALFGEAQFDLEGLSYSLTTLVRWE